MKKLALAVAAIIATACLLFSCKQKSDRLDDIVKDLSKDSYSLSFDKTYPDYGITQTSYGMESFLAYADPQDLICGERWINRFKGAPIPIYKLPKIVQPTCPTMIPIDIATKLSDVLVKANPEQFSGLKQIKLADSKNVLLGNDKFTAQYSSLKADMIDDSVLNNLDAGKYLLLESADNLSSGFTRYFYGNADIKPLMARTKLDFKNIYRPILIGCFDPQILATLKERLAKINASEFGSWQLNKLAQDSSIAVLSYQ